MEDRLRALLANARQAEHLKRESHAKGNAQVTEIGSSRDHNGMSAKITPPSPPYSLRLGSDQRIVFEVLPRVALDWKIDRLSFMCVCLEIPFCGLVAEYSQWIAM